jgi:hypothetical protein
MHGWQRMAITQKTEKVLKTAFVEQLDQIIGTGIVEADFSFGGFLLHVVGGKMQGMG